MKFWKQILLSTLAFFTIGSMTLYISCTKDSCSAVQCQNGGNCVSGECQCQPGYEGTTCGTLAMNRYLGTYYGTTTDKGTSTSWSENRIDTVVVTPGNNLTTVNVSMRAFGTDMFSGSIYTNESGYQILVSPSSGVANGVSYTETVNITLSGNQLIVDKVVTTDTVAEYQFIGNKN
jgi:hypothetical protein